MQTVTTCLPRVLNTGDLPHLEPGIHTGISDEVYFALPYLSKSRLCALATSPAHYLHACKPEPEGLKSDALRFGSAFDLYLFDRPRFDAEYVIAPTCCTPLKSGKRAGQPCGVNANGKYGGLWQCGTHAPKGQPADAFDMNKVLTKEEAAILPHMVAAIGEHPVALELVKTITHSQVVLVWDDSETGIRCKAKLDGFSSYNNGTLWDMKTARDADPVKFARNAQQTKYAMQDAHYTAGFAAIETAMAGKHMPLRDFLFIAIEKTVDEALDHSPILVCRYDADSNEKAAQERERLMSSLHVLLGNDDGTVDAWPGPYVGAGVVEIY